MDLWPLHRILASCNEPQIKSRLDFFVFFNWAMLGFLGCQGAARLQGLQARPGKKTCLLSKLAIFRLTQSSNTSIGLLGDSQNCVVGLVVFALLGKNTLYK